jgi:hypothetical protein
MQDEVNMQKLMTAPLIVWTSSNMWEQPKEKFKRGWNRKNACYHSMQKFVSSGFLFNFKVYGSITFPVICIGV